MQSIENTQLTINELDQVSRQKFEEAFIAINAHFAVAFQSLFGGGTGEMRLTEPDSSGESGIDIAAQPPGKRLQNILLLSGGEKALTALALLIAVFKYQPSPFCILDEVDAPLDEANVGRFNRMLAEMGGPDSVHRRHPQSPARWKWVRRSTASLCRSRAFPSLFPSSGRKPLRARSKRPPAPPNA